MKKAIFLGLLFVLIVPFTSHAALDTNLKYGSTGPSVTELQEFLTSQGVYSGPISGNFYALTLAGVKAFQTKQNISPVSGYWGPLSRTGAQALLDLNTSNTDEQTEIGTVSSVPVPPNGGIVPKYNLPITNPIIQNPLPPVTQDTTGTSIPQDDLNIFITGAPSVPENSYTNSFTYSLNDTVNTLGGLTVNFSLDGVQLKSIVLTADVILRGPHNNMNHAVLNDSLPPTKAGQHILLGTVGTQSSSFTFITNQSQ